MFVDALMQIPWLASILSAIGIVLKNIWDVCVSAWKRVVVWFSAFIPLVITWASQRIAHWVVVLTAYVALLVAAWQLVLVVVGYLVDLVFPWDLLRGDQNAGIGWMLQFVWNEPLNLSVAWDYVEQMPPIVLASNTARAFWRKIRFARLANEHL